MQKTHGSLTRPSSTQKDGKAVQRTAKKWDKGVVYKNIAEAFFKMLN